MNEAFIKDHLWIVIVIVVGFTAFVGYLLNKNSDPSEEWEDDEDNNNENSNNYDQDTRTDSRED
jgi:cytoskeletal protein RodZ